jgi:hypothetical protein
MGKSSIMIKIAVEQILSPAVSYAPEIWAVAFESLDGDRTTVRELATEKNQQFYGWSGDTEQEFGQLHFSRFALRDLWLAFSDLRRPPTILHAPSRVPSPTIDGTRLALLRVQD